MANYVVSDTNLTAVADAIREKGGTSAALEFPDEFVSAIGDISASGGGNVNISQDANGYLVIDPNAPSGGGSGGLTTVASGTFTGADQYWVDIDIGNKMAQTDFMLKIKAKSGEEFAKDTYYKYTTLAAIVLSDYGYYDLSTDGSQKAITSVLSYDEVDGGVGTARAVGSYAGSAAAIRNGGVTFNLGFNTLKISRASTGFTLYHIGNSNASYRWPSTVDYEYEIIYFGSNPSTDIITIEGA